MRSDRIMALVKAYVRSNSSEDRFGRVVIESPGIWEPSPLVCVLGGVPLNVGDIVYVDVSCGYENPMVLGRARDNNFDTHAGKPDFQVLWESVSGDGWTVAYVRGDEFWVENSGGTTVQVVGDTININGGDNRGLLNIAQFESFIRAVAQDLVVAQSGTNVSQWMAEEMPKMEDKRVNH